MGQNDGEVEDESDSRKTNPSIECISDELIIKQLGGNTDDEVRLPSALPGSFQNL